MPTLSRVLLATQTRHEVRSSTQVVFNGVRTDHDHDVDTTERARAALALYPAGVLSGYTAAYFHRADYTDDKPTEITLSHKASRRGIVIRRAKLNPHDFLERNGLRFTTAARTAVDLARYLPGDEAIAAVDQMVREDRFRRASTTVEEIVDYLDSTPHLHRATRVREVLAEVDGRAESPWETYTRLVLHRAGLTMFVPQTVIRDGAIRVDLGADEYTIAVEYDGEYHRSSTQHRRDVERWNAIQFDEGWKLILATSSSITVGQELLLTRARSALTDRGWRPPTDSP